MRHRTISRLCIPSERRSRYSVAKRLGETNARQRAVDENELSIRVVAVSIREEVKPLTGSMRTDVAILPQPTMDEI